MQTIITKVLATPKTVIPVSSLACSTQDSVQIGKELEKRVKKLFKGSLAIREVAAGSSNAEEQELTALANPYYDIERFGIHFVASPRHADMLMVTGPIARNMVEAVRKTYDAMPTPKVVVAVGDGAINGGIFKGSYAVVDSLSDVIPVDFAIPGDPPSPTQVLCALLRILDQLSPKQ